MKSLVVISLLFVFVVGGCVGHVAELTIASNEPLRDVPPPIQRSVTGEHCKVDWAGFGGLQPSLERAINMAQAKAPEANALANVSIDYETQFLLFFMRHCFHVEGDAIKIGE